MASFPSGVAIVTTLAEDGAPRGLTTTAVCSVSAEPPTILVCVDLASRTLAALRASRRFVVNFIGEGRSELCLLFASKAEDKFAHVSWRPTDSGIPLLADDVLAWADCATEHELEVGDHVLLVARVETGACSPSSSRRSCTTGARGASGRPSHDAERARSGGDPGDRGQRPRPQWQGAEY